jgi:arylsulfatase A-like enzyme
MTNGSRPAEGRLGVAAGQLVLWAAAALLTALLTVAWGAITRPGFSVFRWGWDSRDVYWVAPLGYLVVFAPVALLLVGLSFAIRPERAFRVAFFVWVTLICFSLFLLYPAIHGYAWFVIALALGTQLAPWLSRREGAVRRMAGRTALALAVMSVLAFVIVVFGRRNSERKALAALPAAASGAPNVLLIILDTVRAQSLSLYGLSLETSPFLVELGARSVVFDKAYSTAPWTLPSHASMFTGKFASQQSSSWVDPLADDEVTLAEVLRGRGYATGGFTANLGATRYESGLSQGFIRYEDLKTTPREITQTTTITQSDNVLRFWDTIKEGQGVRRALEIFNNSTFAPNWTELTHDLKSAEEVTTSFLTWRKEIGSTHPYFAFLNYFDAHTPYDPPRKYYRMFSKTPKTIDRYHGSIRYIDDELRRLFSELDANGDSKNTIVMITADHGEQFGEHGLRAHGNSLYTQVIRVPLLVFYPPSVPGGVRVGRQVTLRDIPATLLELAKVPRDSAIGGTSLAGTWKDSAFAASTVFSELDKSMRRSQDNKNARGAMKALISDTAHVIRDGVGRVEAYAYRADPEEKVDLAKAPSARDTFRTMLEQEVARHGLKWRTLDESKKK